MVGDVFRATVSILERRRLARSPPWRLVCKCISFPSDTLECAQLATSGNPPGSSRFDEHVPARVRAAVRGNSRRDCDVFAGSHSDLSECSANPGESASRPRLPAGFPGRHQGGAFVVHRRWTGRRHHRAVAVGLLSASPGIGLSGALNIAREKTASHVSNVDPSWRQPGASPRRSHPQNVLTRRADRAGAFLR